MVRHRWLRAGIVLALIGCPLTAQALDESREIRIEFADAQHEALAGVEFRAYEVGAPDGDGIEPCPVLAEYTGRIEATADGYDGTVIDGLDQAVDESALTPAARAVTDEAGRATLGPLEERVYLVEGDGSGADEDRVIPQSFLAMPGDVAHPKPMTVAETTESPLADEPASPPEDPAGDDPGGRYAKTADRLTAAAIAAALCALCALGITRWVRRRQRIRRHCRQRRLW